MKVLTEQHLQAAKRMPRKTCYFADTKDGATFLRQQRRDRKAIASFYRWRAEEGNARLCHRHRVVATGSEARLRLKNAQ